MKKYARYTRKVKQYKNKHNCSQCGAVTASYKWCDDCRNYMKSIKKEYLLAKDKHIIQMY